MTFEFYITIYFASWNNGNNFYKDYYKKLTIRNNNSIYKIQKIIAKYLLIIVRIKLNFQYISEREKNEAS